MPEQLQKQLHEKWAELKSIQLAASRLQQLEAELKATWERIALALERETQTSTEQMALLEKEKEALLLR